jgi:uncharacterized membrane protein
MDVRPYWRLSLAVFRLTAASFLIGAVAGVVVYAAVAMLVIGHVWPHAR